MAHEIETAAIEAGSGFLRWRPRDTLPVGTPCPNCGSGLRGPWCHACGQAAEDYHRSLWRLFTESVAGLWEVDSRLWRTLPNLLFNPAKLTRQYLDGHRAPQAPPFRTFLIVVVLVFLAASAGSNTHTKVQPAPNAETERIRAAMVHVTGGPIEQAINTWLTDRVSYAQAHPDAFDATLQTWAQRMAILALPLSALLLGLLFVFRRGVFMFDHLIFSMHSLSFQGLLFSAMFVVGKVFDPVWWSLWASPVHLFFHMRGTYGLSWYGTLIRMALLFTGSVVGFAFIMAALLLIGLYEVGA